MRIAFVTHAAHAEIEDDDRPLAEALASRGAVVITSSWDDPDFDWSLVDQALLRSPWDYFRRYEEFLLWLARAETGTRVINPPGVVRWNAHKSYLTELAARGVPTVPTLVLDHNRTRPLNELCEMRGWATVVLKPAISADSWETIRVEPDRYVEGERYVARHVPDRDVLVQPFVRDVEEGGEQCLVFFKGKYSHAVRKNSAFRGGRHVGPEGLRIEPEEDAVEMASDVLVKAGVQDLPYARVDIARDDQGRPMLLELELFEPTLFFQQEPGSAAKLADILLR